MVAFHPSPSSHGHLALVSAGKTLSSVFYKVHIRSWTAARGTPGHLVAEYLYGFREPASP